MHARVCICGRVCGRLCIRAVSLRLQNKLTGPLPRSLGALTQLRSLNLEQNLMTGAVPLEWRTLQRLRSVNLRYNRLAGEDDKELKAAHAWCVEKLHPKCEVLVADEPLRRK